MVFCLTLPQCQQRSFVRSLVGQKARAYTAEGQLHQLLQRSIRFLSLSPNVRVSVCVSALSNTRRVPRSAVLLCFLDIDFNHATCSSGCPIRRRALFYRLVERRATTGTHTVPPNASLHPTNGDILSAVGHRCVLKDPKASRMKK